MAIRRQREDDRRESKRQYPRNHRHYEGPSTRLSDVTGDLDPFLSTGYIRLLVVHTRMMSLVSWESLLGDRTCATGFVS